MKKKYGLIIISIFLVLLMIGDIFVSSFFYNLAVARNNKAFLTTTEDIPVTNTETKPKVSGSEKWVNEIGYETVSIKSFDGLKLVGYYIKAKNKTNKTAVLAHGYGGRGKSMGDFAKIYYDMGYNVLMPDNRGHGVSEGNYIGFGWVDRLDYLKWIDFILEEVGENTQIVLHGVSMGGATVMMVSGEDLPKQVMAIVEDCGYTSVEDELAYQLKRMYDLPEFPIIQSTSLLTQIKAGYNFSEASALRQVEKNKVPMLFIHGENDVFVPTSMVYRLYDACRSDKDILVVKGAEHGLSLTKAPIAYKSKVKEFVGKYIK
ncbi:alpha/beta hydrolase [Clostridium sp. YIM B02505]|uniref:Alpha/beta hydrolase n=1 Tax=Clostridium yunnanense TaxID=2800325 RepID=A0ABS1EP70_9CLOT|nr:alpha/beta hydrolase [Clostridium yunnanense]MBK1811120.1 alpha/beta hydrolase [Clostridium yunnanense]